MIFAPQWLGIKQLTIREDGWASLSTARGLKWPAGRTPREPMQQNCSVPAEPISFATTTPLTAGGGGCVGGLRLHLNVETLGGAAIFVEVLDPATGLPLRGRTAADCGPIAGNYLGLAVGWADGSGALLPAAVTASEALSEVALKFVFRGEVRRPKRRSAPVYGVIFSPTSPIAYCRSTSTATGLRHSTAQPQGGFREDGLQIMQSTCSIMLRARIVTLEANCEQKTFTKLYKIIASRLHASRCCLLLRTT